MKWLNDIKDSASAFKEWAKNGNRSKPFTNAVKSLFVSVLTRNIHLLLSAIRELYLEAKVRFITGRPRKAEKSD